MVTYHINKTSLYKIYFNIYNVAYNEVVLWLLLSSLYVHLKRHLIHTPLIGYTNHVIKRLDTYIEVVKIDINNY